MNTIYFWLADANPADVMAKSRSWSDPAKREVILLLSAVALAVLAVFVWAVFFRKPGRRRHRHHHHEGEGYRRAPITPKPEAEEDETEEELEEDEDSAKSGRRHRRRREHRPRNPTLAETGGLPPLRKEPPKASGPS